MKKEELFELLADIDPATVTEARSYRKKGSGWMRWTAVAACAAIIVGAVLVSPLGKKPQQGNTAPLSPGTPSADMTTVSATYPKPFAQNLSTQKFMHSDAHWEWVQSSQEYCQTTIPLQPGMSSYYLSLMANTLPSKHDNTVCSPLNTYIAFSMLADVAAGNTQKQILDMLGVKDVDTLRGNATALWLSNYVDTPTLKSSLSNSMWLNSRFSFNTETLDRLARIYYASSFIGDPTSKEMTNALRKWTDDHTGGLLSDYTKKMTMEADTVMNLLSTIYYKAMWTDEFQAQYNQKQTFHGTKGNTTVEMMRKSGTMPVYRTEDFTGLGLRLRDSGAMYFLLPNKNADVNKLAANPDILKLTQQDDSDEHWSYPTVNLSVPKFKVSAQLDLEGAMRAMGVTDAFVLGEADFTPVTTDEPLYLGKAEHTAMVEIDENGVTGAAYTVLDLMCGAAPPDEIIDFVLDRPFMFLVTGSDGSVLFSGIVRNI